MPDQVLFSEGQLSGYLGALCVLRKRFVSRCTPIVRIYEQSCGKSLPHFIKCYSAFNRTTTFYVNLVAS